MSQTKDHRISILNPLIPIGLRLLTWTGETEKYCINELAASRRCLRLLLAGKRPLAGQNASNLCLFSHLKGIVDLDAKVANCAFQLRMPEQQLYSAKILRPAVD